MTSSKEHCPWKGSSGFTLLELVLATLISALVMGILASSLSFSLRVWERQQNKKTSDMPALLGLLKWQLANFDPVPIATGEGNQMRPLFVGTEHSLTFATDQSVKALSRGAPIIARYIYSEGQKKLYYAERPLDPYHADDLKRFLRMNPDDEKSWPRFYETAVATFSIAYGGPEKGDRLGAWEDENVLPTSVRIKWSPEENAGIHIEVMIPNFLFPAGKDGTGKPKGQPGTPHFDGS